MFTRFRTRKVATAAASATLLVALFCSIWTSQVIYGLPPLGMAVSGPGASLQTGAAAEGLYFGVDLQRLTQRPSLHFRGVRRVNARTSREYGVDLLGFRAVVQPMWHSETCYIESPHLTVVMPYWLLIVGSLAALCYVTPLGSWLRRHGRPNRASGTVLALVLLAFTWFNAYPEVAYPGSAGRAMTRSQWERLWVHPESFFRDIQLRYGFPFCCLRQGFRNGDRVAMYYGAQMGWNSVALMGNLLIAALSGLVAVLAVNGYQVLWKRFEDKETSQAAAKAPSL